MARGAETARPAQANSAARSVSAAPALVVGVRIALWLEPDGVAEEIDHAEAAHRARAGPPPLVCHAPAVARRLRLDRLAALDLLELYAFVRPAGFCLPTPRGLAAALGLEMPKTLVDEARALGAVARALLQELGVTYPNGTIFEAEVITMTNYRVIGMPTTHFITPEGEIVETWTGLLTLGKMTELVEELLVASGVAA